MTSLNGNVLRVTGSLCGNSPVTSEFHAQRPETRSFDVFFDLRLNKRLSKQSRGWWFETPSRSLWRHCNEIPTRLLLVSMLTTIFVCEKGPWVIPRGIPRNARHRPLTQRPCHQLPLRQQGPPRTSHEVDPVTCTEHRTQTSLTAWKSSDRYQCIVTCGGV